MTGKISQNNEPSSETSSLPHNNLGNMDTESLLIRLREGDQSAYEPIFNRYYIKIHQYIRQYIDESDIEDVAQDIFVKVFCNIDKINSLKAFDAYLYRTAKNCAINWLKRKIRLRKMVQFLCYTAKAWRQHDPKGQTEELDSLKQLVNQLPSETRKYIELFYFEKRSREEIAKRLNVSPSTAYRHIAESRAKLMELAEKNHAKISFEGRHDLKIHYVHKDRQDYESR